MTNVSHDAKKNGWRLETWVRGKRVKLWLGGISKSQADTIRGYVHALKLAAETATGCEAHVTRWTNKVDERIATKLAEWGLIAVRSEIASKIKLSVWCDDYMADARNATWSTSTRYQMKAVSKLLISQLGDKYLDKVNEADAELFAAFVYGTSSTSESHGGKQIKRARQFFNHAVKRRILERNPFSAVRASSQIDQARKAYVSPDAAEAILDLLPSQLWRVVFCLGRFAGLRVPSEPLALEWTAIDWQKCRMTVTAPKQVRHKHRAKRIVPMSPILQRELLALSEMAPTGSTFIVDKYRSSATSQFRKPLLQAIEKAGYPIWPKLWINLRASCRTDWLKVAPPHVVNMWLGHDGKVGEKHYDRITEEDWRNITAPTIAPTNKPESRKTS